MTKQSTKSSPVKYCLGNDISKDEMKVCFSQLDGQQHVSIKGSRAFSNNLRGWKALQTWIGKFRKHAETPFVIVVEATGVYYEGFAYYFKEQGFDLHVVLPNKSKHYAKSLNIKTKNDVVDARLLAQMGLERQLSVWKGMDSNILKIKQLCRQRTALQETRTMVSNQLHAHTHAYNPLKLVVNQMQKHLEFLDKQIKALEAEVTTICASNAQLQQKVDNICTIKGMGIMTALVVIAETNGFDLIENKAQLVSYAGYDVVENQSGTSLKGKTRISKKGNSHIRRALYFPALSAAKHEPKLQNLYERIHEKNPKTKMIGAIAVQRKLLVLIYTLYKKNESYDPMFENRKTEPLQKSRQDLRLAYTA
jgi:transposase